MNTLALLMTVFMPVFVAIGMLVAVLAIKPKSRPNYPRIEHLRIAGKYQAMGRFGEIGVNPLNLRG
jgi:hypothetical protein